MAQWAPTPVEALGPIWLKREDAFEVAGHHGGKVRTCLALAEAGQAAGADTLVTAGSRHSPQVAMVAAVARYLGMRAQVHVPDGPATPELEQAAAAGAVVRGHRPGYNGVIVARARQAADELGPRACLIPFGMECAEAVALTARQVAYLNADTTRIVVAVGSGMSLAGILTGLEGNDWPVPVLGIVVGADPTKRLDRWAPPWWRHTVELRPAGLPYQDHLDRPVWPAWAGPGVPVDPVYEAKAVAHLAPGDTFWIVGRRAA